MSSSDAPRRPQAPGPAKRAAPPLVSATATAGGAPDEAIFHDERQALLVSRIRVTALVFTGIHLTAMAVAAGLQHVPVWPHQWTRLLVIGGSLGLALATLPAVARRWALPLSVALLWGTAVFLLSFPLRGGLPGLDIPGLTLLLVASSLLFPYSGREMLGVGGVIVGGFLAVALAVRAPGHTHILLSGIFFAAVSLATAVIAARLGHRLRRRELAARLAAEHERERAEGLLRNILPEAIVQRLQTAGESVVDGISEATVLFADIVGFTPLSARLSPEQLVALLDALFSEFDRLTEELGLEKIKTIGDAYMAAGGVPEHRTDHAAAVARLALRLREIVQGFEPATGERLDIRVGINTGPVVAGVIGTHKFVYDLWGDTVNTASRMESHAEPGTIQLTPATAALLGDDFELERRGTIDVKGKGPMEVFRLLAERPAAAPPAPAA